MERSTLLIISFCVVLGAFMIHAGLGVISIGIFIWVFYEIS